MSRALVNRLVLAAAIIISALSLFLISCQKKKAEVEIPQFFLPFPDSGLAKFLQVRVDSSEFLWFTDVKSTASAFFNDQMGQTDTVSVGDVIVLGEGLFHAQAEVQLPSKIYILTMERPFKNRGVNSIWQITKVEEKDWPGKQSKSAG